MGGFGLAGLGWWVENYWKFVGVLNKFFGKLFVGGVFEFGGKLVGVGLIFWECSEVVFGEFF